MISPQIIECRSPYYEHHSHSYGDRMSSICDERTQNRSELDKSLSISFENCSNNDPDIESNPSWNWHPQHKNKVAHHTSLEPHELWYDADTYAPRNTLKAIDRTQGLSTKLSIAQAQPLNNRDTSVSRASAPSVLPTGDTSWQRLPEDNLMVWAQIVDARSAPMPKDLKSHNEHTESPDDPRSPLSLPNRRTSQGRHKVWSTIASITGVIAAYTMNNYTLQRREPDQQVQTSYTGFNALIMHPSPDIFVAASIIHGISTYVYYETRSKDRFREWFLAFGAASGSAGVVLAGVSVQDLLSGFLPGVLILSLILCTSVNMLWIGCDRNRSLNKDQGWGGEAV